MGGVDEPGPHPTFRWSGMTADGNRAVPAIPGSAGCRCPTSRSPQAPTLSGRLEEASAVDGAAQAAAITSRRARPWGRCSYPPGTVGTVKATTPGLSIRRGTSGTSECCAPQNGSGVNGLRVINTFSGSITWSNTNSKWTSRDRYRHGCVGPENPQDLALLVSGNSLLQVNLATLTFTDPSVDAGSLVAIAPWSPRLLTADFRARSQRGCLQTIQFSPILPLTFSASDWGSITPAKETFPCSA